MQVMLGAGHKLSHSKLIFLFGQGSTCMYWAGSATTIVYLVVKHTGNHTLVINTPGKCTLAMCSARAKTTFRHGIHNLELVPYTLQV